MLSCVYFIVCYVYLVPLKCLKWNETENGFTDFQHKNCGASLRPPNKLNRFLLQECLRSIVMSLCVCLSAKISPEPNVRSLPNFCARCLWPWLSPSLASLWYVMYFWFPWVKSVYDCLVCLMYLEHWLAAAYFKIWNNLWKCVLTFRKVWILSNDNGPLLSITIIM